MAVRAECHQIPKRIIAWLAALCLMMDRQVVQRPPLLVSRVDPLETRITDRR